MPRQKGKRTFLKIKEKLVFIPPKQLRGRKFLGVLCLVAGSLILAITASYFYILPRFFPAKTKVVAIKAEKEPFIARRVLILNRNLDFTADGDKVEGEIPLAVTKISSGDEILVLSQNAYRSYRVVKVIDQPGLATAKLSLIGNLTLILPLKTKPVRNIIIEAEATAGFK